MSETRDVVVIGAGFGGLAAALELARAGARVTLCEALKYPGGCASTFVRGGTRFESGATLFSGFGPGQLFTRWVEEFALPVRFVPLDPIISLRAPGLSLDVPGDRALFIDRLCAFEGAPVARLRRFFEEQRAVADALWALFDDPARLPPFGLGALAFHASKLPAYLPVLRVVGRPLGAVLERHGLLGFAPLRIWLDAVCQITVQASAAEAEAPFAMGAMDYPFRGTGHVHGGIGVLAEALAEAIARCGGEVRFADKVRAVESTPNGFRVHARRGVLEARHVVANLLPQDLARLASLPSSPALEAHAAEVASGWSATMLYLEVDGARLDGDAPHHFELVGDASRPFLEGNHVFVSISGADEEGRAGAGRRTVTVSTHVSVAALRGLDPEARRARIEAVQTAMRATVDARLPILREATVREMTASPRTFERFTGRTEGLVGGIPRKAGLHHYRRLGLSEPARGLHLVGDSVFPGQSTLATALGGVKVAAAIAGRLRLAARPRLPG